MQGKTINWFTDNLGGVSVIRKGSMKEDLNPIAASIVDMCQKRDMKLQVKWIRRDENKMADKLSRFIDLDEWGITDQFFQEIQQDWGYCSCDRFASAENAKLENFNSKFAAEGASAIDAFSQDWSGHTNWLCPPPYLIPKVLDHAKRCKARGILVIPNWPSARFWPFLFTGKGPEKFIKKQKLVQNGASIIKEGKQPNSIFTPRRFKKAMLALFVDFT